MTTDSETNSNNPEAEDHGRDRTVIVKVNDEPVTLEDRSQSGAEIKAAAISAGIPIQHDFVLSEVRKNGKQRIVRDDEILHVKNGDEFWAIPGDDNS